MWKKLEAADGHFLQAYEAGAGNRRGMVVIQEIFGVNAHIRTVCDRFAAEGYHAVAPALFDRALADVELGYDDNGLKEGLRLVGEVGPQGPILDVEAALGYLLSLEIPVGVVGFCWGGTLAWLSACRLPALGAAVGFYGGGMVKYLEEPLLCPVMLHFGEKDKHIPLSDVETIRAAHPEVPVYTYPADHGFNCDARGSYDEESARIARGRTLAFFDEHLH